MDQQARQEILDLISMYSYGYDNQEWEVLGSIWTEDATLIGGPTELRTPAAIVNAARIRRQRLAAEGIQTRHYQTNTLLTFTGDGRATARTMMFVAWQRKGESAPIPMHTGIYTDEFVRTPIGWRIASRRGDIDHD